MNNYKHDYRKHSVKELTLRSLADYKLLASLPVYQLSARPRDETLPKVFISHSFEDQEEFRNLSFTFRAAEIDVWDSDELLAGSPLSDQLRARNRRLCRLRLSGDEAVHSLSVVLG